MHKAFSNKRLLSPGRYKPEAHAMQGSPKFELMMSKIQRGMVEVSIEEDSVSIVLTMVSFYRE